MSQKYLCIIFFCMIVHRAGGQTGGDNIYEFLNLSHSGFVTSLGGINVSVCGRGLNMAYQNPSLLGPGDDKSLAINYVNYFAGINYGSVIYSRSFVPAGSFAAGITYLNYGTFIGADPSGNITGTFTASEYAFSCIYSRRLDSLFAFGATVRPVLSHLEKYTSFGFAVDIGASWHSRNELVSAGLILRNAGLQLTTYAGEGRQPLPFEIIAGATTRLAHAPLRFSLTLRHLEKFDLTHNYSSDGEEDQDYGRDLAGDLLRHVVIGAEFLPHRNFYFSLGYNFQRKSELGLEEGSGATGFSWGFGFNTTTLSIEFGRASFHPAGVSNNISLVLRPDLLYSRLRK